MVFGTVRWGSSLPSAAPGAMLRVPAQAACTAPLMSTFRPGLCRYQPCVAIATAERPSSLALATGIDSSRRRASAISAESRQGSMMGMGGRSDRGGTAGIGRSDESTSAPFRPAER